MPLARARSRHGPSEDEDAILAAGGRCMAENIIHEILPVGLLQCNCSVVGDPQTREAIVLDPGDEVERILEIIARHKLTVRAILNTHAHIDHVGGLKKMQQATGAPVLMHPDDLELYRRLDTQAPGPTRGSVCLYLPADAHLESGKPPAKLFAGDTLFAGSIGRTDLPGGSFDLIMRSIHSKLLALPDDTLVYPGHGPTTTIGEERESNPFLRSL